MEKKKHNISSFLNNDDSTIDQTVSMFNTPYITDLHNNSISNNSSSSHKKDPFSGKRNKSLDHLNLASNYPSSIAEESQDSAEEDYKDSNKSL